MTDRELQHIITKARDAKHGGFGVLSTGEKLAVALVLNRPEWLALIPEAARALEYEDEQADDRA